jgi:N-acetylglutamate synthase-like GNAT family acetyltransferase
MHYCVEIKLPINIRAATLDDMPVIFKYLKDSSAFYQTKHQLYGNDPVYAQRILKGLIEEHVFYVAETEGTIIGLIAGMLVPHIFNQDLLTLTQIFWWVKPEYRHGKTGLMLLNAFNEHGERDADWIICVTHKDTPINDRSFIKRGFHLKEKNFLKEI